jgi:hypothetical protein
MSWQRARIIPVTGIKSETEAEQRATSALMAVLGIVRPFSQALLNQFGAPKADRAQVDCYIEPQFKDELGKPIRPDGLIRITVGAKQSWTALVEVKTGPSKLDADQLNAYWELARRENFDAVISISNQIPLTPGAHPTDGLKVKANSKIQIHHLSWTRIATIAVIEKRHRGVSDPEQAWILGELIRYLEHDASGAMGFDDMGPNWTEVRDGARTGTINPKGEAATDIAQRWDQLLEFIALRLSAEIGVHVTEIVSRSELADPKLRTKNFVDSLCTKGVLDGSLKIPKAASDLSIICDLKAKLVVASSVIAAPSDRGDKARVTWLIRQLKNSPAGLVIEAYGKGSGTPCTSTLGAATEDPSLLVKGIADIQRFRLVSRVELGGNRKSGKNGGFSQSVVKAVEDFYRDVLQHLSPHQPKAPQISPSAAFGASELGVPAAGAGPLGMVSEPQISDDNVSTTFSHNAAADENPALVESGLLQAIASPEKLDAPVPSESSATPGSAEA